MNMIFLNSICLITEDVEKLAKFYEEVLQTKTEINSIHVEITIDGGSIIIYSKSAAEEDIPGVPVQCISEI